MKNYLELLEKVVKTGERKSPARENMPETIELFGETLKFDLTEGFPLLTTKKMFHTGVVAELLWFLRGSTNVGDLIKLGTNIWNKDAYRYYLEEHSYGPDTLTYDEWVEKVKAGDLGDCGKIYGYQWRNWEGDGNYGGKGYDQIGNLLKNLKSNPNSRYHLVTSWNPEDFFANREAALPACHVMFQVNVRDGKFLDIMVMQRSCDLFLGVPFNIASYALLCHILAKQTGYLPGQLTWVGGSVHVYENHLDAVKEQLERSPLTLCSLYFERKDSIEQYNVEDFHFLNYKCYSQIKAPLSVGL